MLHEQILLCDSLRSSLVAKNTAVSQLKQKEAERKRKREEEEVQVVAHDRKPIPAMRPSFAKALAALKKPAPAPVLSAPTPPPALTPALAPTPAPAQVPVVSAPTLAPAQAPAPAPGPPAA